MGSLVISPKAIELLGLEINKSILFISYRIFPYNFSRIYFKRDNLKILPDIYDVRKAARQRYNTYQEDDFFSQNMLNKRGSISRGISLGNSQDVSVNSNLNLQLSGRINDNFEVKAAISDNNIPIQPDGNSQNIREFDKVYINIFNKKTSLIAGDFEIDKPVGYFMNMYKKVQGGMFSSLFNLKEKKTFKTTLSGAVSKGKYNRMKILGQEGNQGPYKLFGAENEKYIIVLAGTEKVYIDGLLLIRGQDQDYIIDYNSSELIFTPRQTINKDKRIVVEFEYSDKNYARFLLFNSNNLTTEKSSFYINVFSESDAKNQPVTQDMDEEQRKILSGIGDNLESGIFSSIDSVMFSTDLVLYKMVDTTVNKIHFDTVFVYSMNPDSAFYRLSFSIVGQNKGDYILDKSAANGSVYKWVAPENGSPSGNYAPVVSLVSPKKNQMIVAGAKSRISRNTSAGFELAYTRNDLNTFSNNGDEDNNGYAARLFFENTTVFGKSRKTNLSTLLNYRLISTNFRPVERIRSVEFERDWNLGNNNYSDNEHLLNTNFILSEKNHQIANLNINFLNKGQSYKGIKNNISANYSKKGVELFIDGSLLNSSDVINKTSFLRHKAGMSKEFRLLKIGIREEGEKNSWRNSESDSLMENSFVYKQWELYISNPDSSKNNFFGSYKQRSDYLPFNNDLNKSSLGKDLNLGLNLSKNPNINLKSSINYRLLEIYTDNINKQNENNLTARFEYFFRLFKGSISSSTFFETGSGLEYKKEYSYIELAPGQGVYAWTDYNNNGIKEIDEFEVAKFRDQASYIRIYKPGQETVKVFNNQFNQLINIRPAIIWRKEIGFKKFISKFSNNFAYKIDRNTLQDNFLMSVNPFSQNVNDTSLISINSSLRNTLSFNRSNSNFGFDFILQDNKNRILLVNGLETRKKSLIGNRLRIKAGQNLNLNNNFDYGTRLYNSEYFIYKNYEIKFFRNELICNYQAGRNLRLGVSYDYSDKKNILNIERSFQHKFGSEIVFSRTRKSNISFKINYVWINYNADTNTSLSYNMLEGLLPGNNATWELLFQKSISETLKMNINYAGRVSQDSKTIHTGNISLRASF